jgi:hypothetical protein
MVKPGKGKKNGVQQKRDTITPTYKNMDMFNSMRAQAKSRGGGIARTPTSRDTANYNSGFKFGLNNKAPKKPFKNEGYMFRAGRWEGQNNPNSVNKKKQTKSKSFIDKFFGN